MKSRTKEYRAIYWKQWAAKNKPPKLRPCNSCGLAFSPRGRQSLCKNCRSGKCAQCGTVFPFKDGQRFMKYCSRTCKDDSQKGIEPPRLAANRGRKPRTYHLRHRDKHGSAADREWRKAVFERDDYTCQICFQRGGRFAGRSYQAVQGIPRTATRLIERSDALRSLSPQDGDLRMVGVLAKAGDCGEPSASRGFAIRIGPQNVFRSQYSGVTGRRLDLNELRLRQEVLAFA